MKKALLLVIGLIIAIHTNLSSQSCEDASVEISAIVQTSPPQITLNWQSNASTTQYTVYRKLKTDNSWGTVIISLAGTANQFIDNAVAVGVSYEYKIIRNATNYTGYGYINAGIQIPVVEQRGKLILLVDSFFVTSCATEISRLEDDLIGDGWKVIRHNVARTMSVPNVKALIIADYNADPVFTKALFLLGHIPVPYSGNLNPDGHPDHQGAWPADVYYADVNGTWTDNIVNNTVANDPRNDNIPGDGKFDQSSLPSDVELQTGRVDFYNLPAFTATEDVLMQNYLNKDHNYRHKVFSPIHRAVVDDNFGYFSGESFAASGWKNFGPLVDPVNATSADYFPAMTGNSYLWSYGCGGGWYQGSSGVGSTSDFALSDLQGVFTILFGSYFGDWDSQDNFLRAPLAQGQMLTDAWSGRPHWQFHHMGLGENIGYCAKLTQNNNAVYFASYGARFVHIALMGDPSLRNDIVAPVSNLSATFTGNNCSLSWTASTDNVLGYNIYRKTATTDYMRLNQYPLAATSFTDFCIQAPGIYTYMVKGLLLQSSPSGTYYNLSQGISDTAQHQDLYFVTANATYTEQNGDVNFTNTSLNANDYLWDFGDGNYSIDENPAHTYGPGVYYVNLIASNTCDSDTLTLVIAVIPQFNTIQGTLIYDGPLSLGMPYTTIVLKDSADNIIDIAITNIDGNYTFTDVPNGKYTLHPTTTIVAGGYNATDALLTLRHFVHISVLTGLKFQAGDVDNNNFINSLDALMISKRFIDELPSFPAGDWYFEEPAITVNGALTFTKNFKCICTGDCNGSFVPF